ncbi:MAG TPA: hypothetical protein VFU49_14655 [Ktedonobacteraceae bacterium]|nr:hypothetical protein [Ktedonobacteraceae bacterium]
MIFSKRPANWRILSSIAMLMLTLLLVGCGTDSTTGTTATPTPKPPTPTPTPNVVPQTFTGKDFTVKYPTDWKTSGDNPVIITDSVGIYNMTITSIANANGDATVDKVLDGGISGAKGTMKTPDTVNMPATTTVGGQTWSQRAISDTSSADGVELVALAINYPDKSPNTKSYLIIYATTKALFDQASTKYFMPMLQSFKFNP